ncbi:MAG: DUF808 domain-containing protein [Chitinophagales bacterium]|nr:DUF808 domain-containing protein [Chitinophagales bacterium]
MASGIFAVLDDISILMDDIASMSKIATKKTAGILGDDLAVNAEKATGFLASRELPVLWAITKGSLINKVIILPLIFILSYYAPLLIQYILLVGGFYLAYEGAHKVYEVLFKREQPTSESGQAPRETTTIDESVKIKDAIKTDFILSIEIIIIALSTVLGKNLLTQIVTVSIVALLATVGVYGVVALIVRMDDFGFFLIRKSSKHKFFANLGAYLVKLLPMVIKSLSVIGTIALLLVSGGIFHHNHIYIPPFIQHLPTIIVEFLSGLMYGSVVVFILEGGKALLSKSKLSQ